jgi:excisionase family DNA binding protein
VEPSYLTPPQVAKYLRVNPATVIAWIRSGELVASNLSRKRGGRPRYRISREALDAFLRARQPNAGKPRKRGRAAGGGKVIQFI